MILWDLGGRHGAANGDQYTRYSVGAVAWGGIKSRTLDDEVHPSEF